jgi:hypothetical protein
MKFLSNWTINFDKLPNYLAFKDAFQVKLDYYLLQKCFESNNPVFTNERKSLLEPLLNNINKMDNTLIIKHNQRYNIGRFYPNESISPISISRHIKHTLFHYLNWIDLDMVKGHASIIYNVSKKNNIKLTFFEQYLENSNNIFKELIDYYAKDDKLTQDNVKDIFNIAIYGGSHKTWLESISKVSIELKTEKEHPFVTGFITDCKRVIDLVYLNNSELTNKIKGNLEDEHKLKNRTMSYWCGTIENEIIYICYKFLIKKNVIEPRNCVLEFDGLCFKRNEEHDETFLNNILYDLNDKIVKDTGFNIKMSWKKYKSIHIHQDIIDDVNEYYSNTTPIKYHTFNELAIEFEKSHCKIKNKGVFVKHDNNKIIVLSKSMLLIAYENIVYYKSEKKLNNQIIVECNFIKDWLRNNPKQRCYEDIECYPPGTNCPPNFFNTWTPFSMELVNTYEHKEESLKTILHHIKILCNHEEHIYDYFIKWIAQMIQYPSVKTICPVFISEEGAGKGVLIKLFREMLGNDKVFESTQPERDVWGDFNNKMANSFLVNLNELSKKDTINCDGRIKALITDPMLTINDKGVSKYEIKSYHRFIITTNNEDPIKTSDDDRRKIIIRSSDEKCKNKHYFDNIYESLKDVNVIKTCYEYFNSIPDMDKFNLLLLPTTSYHTHLKELSKSPIDQWLYDFVVNNGDLEEVKETSGNIYNSFLEWCRNNNIDYKVSNIEFSVRLKQTKVKGIMKGPNTKRGKTLIFDIKELKTFLNIK